MLGKLLCRSLRHQAHCLKSKGQVQVDNVVADLILHESPAPHLVPDGVLDKVLDSGTHYVGVSVGDFKAFEKKLPPFRILDFKVVNETFAHQQIGTDSLKVANESCSREINDI